MRIQALLFSLVLASCSAAAADVELRSRFAARLATVLPDAEITSVRPTPVDGLYEVALGPRVLYMSDDGRYVLNGDLMDIVERRNISEERRAEQRVSALAAAAEGAIQFGPADPRHVLYVFTDIDCTYCRRFHSEIDQLTAAGIAVRYLAFPRAGLRSESYRKAVSVWCAEDKRRALTDAKAGRAIAQAQCDSPVEEQFALGEALGVRGTPAVYLDDGRELGGYIPAPRLVQMLNDDDES